MRLVGRGIQTLRDLASPVAAFVREECVVGQDKSVKRDTLYSAYRAWADNGGYPKSLKHVFSMPRLRRSRRWGRRMGRATMPGSTSSSTDPAQTIPPESRQGSMHRLLKRSYDPSNPGKRSAIARARARRK